MPTSPANIRRLNSFKPGLGLLVVLAIAWCLPGCDSSPPPAQPTAQSPPAPPVPEAPPTPPQPGMPLRRGPATPSPPTGPFVNPLDSYSPQAPPEFPAVEATNASEAQSANIRTLTPSGFDVTALSFSRDGRFLVIVREDRIEIMDVKTATPLRSMGVSGGITAVQLSPDGTRLVVGGKDQRLRILDAHLGVDLFELKDYYDHQNGEPQLAQFCPDPRLVITQRIGQAEAALWDVATGRDAGGVHSNAGFRGEGLRCITFMPNGKDLLMAGPSNNYSVEHIVKTGNPSAGRSGPGSPVVATSVSPDGKWLALAHASGQLEMIEYAKSLGKEKKVVMVGQPSKVKATTFLPGGKYLAVYHGGNNVEYWDIADGQAAGQTAGKTDDVLCAAISPDGRHVAAGYRGGMLQFGTLQPPLQSAGSELQQLTTHVQTLLEQRKFAELEQLVKQVRTDRSLDSQGRTRMELFYHAASHPFAKVGEPWTSLLEQLQAWQAAQPASAAAETALTDFYANYAWDARGTQAAALVDPENARRFVDRLAEAARHSVVATQKTDVDAEAYRAQIMIAMGLSSDKEKVVATLKRGMQVDKLYFPMYSAITYCLLPRWGGAEGDIARLAARVRDEVGGKDGLEIYGRMACDVWTTDTLEALDVWDFDPPTLWQAAQRLLERYPANVRYRNFAVAAACVAHERDAARALMEQLNQRLDPQTFGREPVQTRYRIWAYFNPRHDQSVRSIEAHHTPVYSVKFSPDGKMLATTSSDALAQVKLWDPATGKLLSRIPHALPVTRCFFGEKNLLITVGGAEGVGFVRLHRLGEKQPPVELGRYPAMILAADLSSDRKLLAIAGEDRTVRVVDLAKPDDPIKLDAPDTVRSVAFSNDDKYVIAGCEDGELVIYSLKVQKPGAVMRQVAAPVVGVSGSGRLLAAVGAQPAAMLMDFTNNQVRMIGSVHRIPRSGSTHGIRPSVALSKDGRLMASGIDEQVSPTNVVDLYSTADEKSLVYFLGHAGQVVCLDFSPDETMVVSGSIDGSVKFWPVPSQSAPETVPGR